MKNTFLIYILVVACAFTGCAGDDSYTFPSTVLNESAKLINIGSYDITELDTEDYIIVPMEFTVSLPWTLSADKMWVLFSDSEDGIYSNDIIGVAGTHKVYLKITNDARAFESAEANITLQSSDIKQVLTTISRHAKSLNCEIVDSEGNVIDALEVNQESASLEFKLNANYTCGIGTYPEWLGEPSVVDGAYVFSVKEYYRPYELAGEIEVVSKDGAASKTIAVTYGGMAPDMMTITGAYSTYGWLLSLDGKTFLYESSSSMSDTPSEEIQVDGALTYNIVCFNYDCKFVLVEENDGTISIPTENWLVAVQDENDKSLVSLTATPFNATTDVRSRKGNLFAVPSGLYDSFVEEVKNVADLDEFYVKYEYCLLISVEQKDIFAPEGFAVKVLSSGAVVECTAEPAGDLYDFISSEFSTTDVYTVSVDNRVKYEINTLYTKSDWGGRFKIFDVVLPNSGGTTNDTSDFTWPIQVKLVDGYYVMTVPVPNATIFNMPVIIVLYENNALVPKKILIVKPNK